MVTTIGKPSSLLHEIRIERVEIWNLFKFSESLQLRMESLLEKKKEDELTPDEIAELDAIGELDRIFTHINAMLSVCDPQTLVRSLYMNLELYQEVALTRDVPESQMKAGDVATLIDFVSHPQNGESGVVLEAFNAIGESISVVTVPLSAVKALGADEVLSVRSLVEVI